MSDSFIRLPPDSTGKRCDTEQITVGANVVQRGRYQIAGASAAEIARVHNAAPANTDYGMVVRPAPGQLQYASLQTSHATQASVSPGGTTRLESDNVGASKTGRLVSVIISGSRPWKAQLQTASDGVYSNDVLVWFSTDPTPQIPYGAFTATYSAAAGLDGWSVRLTNLDPGGDASDYYATFFWDEI